WRGNRVEDRCLHEAGLYPGSGRGFRGCSPRIHRQNRGTPAADPLLRENGLVTDFETVVAGLVLPEGPRWHEGALWLSDIGAGRVLRVDVATNEVEVVTDAIGMPSGLGFLPGGDPI